MVEPFAEEESRDDSNELRESPTPERSGKATASLVLGIFSFCVPVVLSLGAVILGILCLRDIARSRGRLQGTGRAIGGIVTGTLSLVLVPPVLLIVVLLPAFQKVRQVQSQKNLQQLVLAMHHYHDTNQRFPPAAICDETGKPLHSWRVLVLPYLGQDSLYRQLKLSEPWDSPHNQKLLAQMPRVFGAPGSDPTDTTTYYQVFVGPDAPFGSFPALAVRPFFLEGRSEEVFVNGKTPTIVNFTDGTSNTLLIAEAAEAVPWTKPVDLLFKADEPLPSLGGITPGVINVALADGSVRALPRTLGEKILRALITPNGNEIIGVLPSEQKPPSKSPKRPQGDVMKDYFGAF